MAEEMTVLPGMDELGNLLWIGDHVDQGDYDLIVVDAAPTGETLRLLRCPRRAAGGSRRSRPSAGAISKLGRSASSSAWSACRCPSDEVFEPARSSSAG